MMTVHSEPSAARPLPPPTAGKSGWPWMARGAKAVGPVEDGIAWPTISVVMPSLNQGRFIEAAIRSVLLQAYPQLEFIIIDGGSTDDTPAIIKKYEPWLALWISEPDRGQSQAINKGIERSTGHIVYWLNSDDMCLPDAFFIVARAFSENPDVRIVSGQAQIIDEEGTVIGHLRSYFTSWEELATNPGNSVRQVSTFFARNLFDELGGLDETLHIAMDSELLVRFTRLYAPLILDDCLAGARKHKAAKTHHAFGTQYLETDRVRPRYLNDQRLASMYRARSAANWLSLSKSRRLAPGRALGCILQSIRNRPAIVFSRDFVQAFGQLALAPRRAGESMEQTRIG
jgi:glycosyltransferase involved in cell wall biosynthesis